MDPDTIWRYQDDLSRLAQQLCPNPHDAEDVTQSALMKAVQASDGFRGEATVRTWLHRIATNECLMMLRKKRPESVDDVESVVAAGDPTRHVDTPEELVMVSETQGEVLAALADLPERHRTVVMVVDGCGMTYDQAAEAVGITPAAVRSILFRARRSLKTRLAEADTKRPTG